MEESKDLYIENKRDLINDIKKSPTKETLFADGVTLKKIERLSSALHLVTGLISRDEPLRTHLRSSSLSLLSLSVANTKEAALILIELDRILFLLDIGEVSGLISPMNKAILAREYGELRARVAEEERKTSEEVSALIASPVLHFALKEKTPLEEKDLEVALSQSAPTTPLVINDISKRHERNVVYNKDITIGQKKDKNEKKSALFIKGNGDERKKKILDAMKIKKELTIKDISYMFPEITEKTLQRDILHLMEKKLVERVGDKRWSKYKLA